MMEYSRELLFFFSALGAFNGLLMGLYFLFFAKPKHPSNYFLGAFLLGLSIRIGKSVFFFFNPSLSFNFLQLGLSACFFIGPALYFYLKSITHDELSATKNWKYHFGLLLLIILTVGLVFPFESNVQLWRPYFLKAIYLQWLAYTLAGGLLLVPIFKKGISKTTELESIEVWSMSIFIGNVIVWGAYFFSSYTSYISGALSFSLIFYLLILVVFFNKKQRSILYKSKPKYGNKKIESEEANLLLIQLTSIMDEEKIFKNPNLKILDVAQKANIKSHLLSQLINDNLGKSFPSFLNEYRIKEAEKMLLSHQHLTLEAIGYECGFKSNSTFYASFKKIKGVTPAQFKREFI